MVGPGGDRVAEVADLLVGPDGAVRGAVLAVGGFLGLGARPVALGLDRLRVGPGGEVATDATAEQLEALPRHEPPR